MPKDNRLGRGIGALIPDIGEEILGAKPGTKKGMLQVDIVDINLNPFQPRKFFSEPEMAELATSIKSKGVLQPLLVSCSKEGGYQLIAGERRLRAAQSAGLSRVPVVVVDAEEKDFAEIALIENIQREDLNVVEEAEAYQKLIEHFEYTQEELSRRVGKSRTVITNALRLLRLSKGIKKALVEKKISMGHARAYLGLDQSCQQEELHSQVVKKGLSVRQTEGLVKSLGNKKQKKPTNTDKTIEIQDGFIENELRKKFSTKIKIVKSGEKGKIVIEFYSAEEFDRIYDLLRGSAT